MKVIRILIYEGNERWLRNQLFRSLPDGDGHPSEMIPGVSVRTIHSDIDLDLLGTDGRDRKWEGETPRDKVLAHLAQMAAKQFDITRSVTPEEHQEADEALLQLIDDPEVINAWRAVKKGYPT